MTTSKGKIFGVGLSKTGTTSLANALQVLGYKTKDYPGIKSYRAGDLSSVDLDIVNAHDALTDTPIPSFYRELDAKYPGSKFILTVRDMDGWLRSCKKQFTERLAGIQTEAHSRLFMDLYGCTAFDEQKFRSGYQRFVAGVSEYFKDRPADLLVIDVAAGEGWEKLCPFLGKPVPDAPFPKANVTRIRWINVNDVVAVAQRAGNEILRAYELECGDYEGYKRTRTGPMRPLRYLFDKAGHALWGNHVQALQAAIRTAGETISLGLKKLQPDIPVLSRLENPVPYPQRRGWNHLWLVDPFDGGEALSNSAGDFTVNIALIEDGNPIYGVVYAPLSDTVYYASAGKGSFKITSGGDPQRLDARLTRSQEKADQPAQSRDAARLRSEEHSASTSRALEVCLAAEREGADSCLLSQTMEWQIAAGHAVAREAGMQLTGEAGEEVTYNKEDMFNRRVVRLCKEPT
jgi:3'-phosphoadenosine 5'-phosphosulfate (PAPS) 3'-phosphatase